MTEITKGDVKTYDAYKTAVDAGWLSKNEIRATEDLARIEGLDVVGMGLGDVLFDVKSPPIPFNHLAKPRTSSQGKPTTRLRALAIERDTLVAAGIAVRAADTGRVLMLQRSNEDEEDWPRHTGVPRRNA